MFPDNAVYRWRDEEHFKQLVKTHNRDEVIWGIAVLALYILRDRPSYDKRLLVFELLEDE